MIIIFLLKQILPSRIKFNVLSNIHVHVSAIKATVTQQTIVCPVIWAGGDLILIQTSLPFCVNTVVLMLTSDIYMTKVERSVSKQGHLQPFKDHVTQQTTVKWSILQRGDDEMPKNYHILKSPPTLLRSRRFDLQKIMCKTTMSLSSHTIGSIASLVHYTKLQYNARDNYQRKLASSVKLLLTSNDSLNSC